jgi:hypothetical protein
MSNIIPANIQVPAHLAARVGVPSVLAQSLTGGLSSGNSFPRISIKGARFRIVEGDTETVLDSTTLQVVIVGANPYLSKIWYASAWTPDADQNSAPDCFSLNGQTPHPDSTSPQNDLCASCPQNAWGSKITPQGQQIKACADQKRLAVVAADDPEGPIYLLQVTPAALKGLNQYQKELAVRGIPPEIVRTAVSFDTDASFPKLKFTFGGFLDADTQAVVDQLFGSETVLEVTGESQAVAVTVQSAPAWRAGRLAPAPEPEPEPAPAPAKRGFGAKTPAAQPEPEPAPAKRGFGTKAPATPAKRVTPAKAGAGAGATTMTEAGAASLADEIASLIGEVGDDDA